MTPFLMSRRFPLTLPHLSPEEAETLRAWRGMREKGEQKKLRGGAKHVSAPHCIE